MRRRCSQRDQRGTVVLQAVLFLTALMTSAAYVVDLGMQRVTRGDLQALVDVVALDLARELGGRSVAELTPVLDDLAGESLARNDSVLGDVDPDLDVDLGDLGLQGRFVAISSGVPTAVRVSASAEVEFAFAGVTGRGSGRATRSAVAGATQSACFSVGSYAAAVDTGSSAVLDPLLDKLAEQTGGFANGYAVGQAISYQGLAAVTVRLGDVAAALGLASVTELATARVDLKRYYGAIRAAIGPGNATAFSMLGTMATSANATRTVDLASMLQLRSGGRALAELRANVLDLVLGSLYAINGTNGVDLYLSSGLSRLGYLGVKVKAVQGPRLYCGGPGSAFSTAASTEQLNITGQGNLNPVTVTTTLAPIPGLTLAEANLSAPMWSTMPFSLSVAATQASLERVRCRPSPGVDLSVVNRLARLVLTGVQFSEAKFDTTLRVAGVDVEAAVVVGSANADITVDLGRTATVPVTIDVPPRAFDTPYPTQSAGVNAVARLTATPSVRISSKVRVPGLNLSVGASVNVPEADRLRIAQAVVDRVVQVAFDENDPTSLTRSVFAPLLSLGGVRIAGSDVMLASQPPIDCGRPALRG